MKIFKSYNIKNIVNICLFTLILFILLIFSKDNFESVKNTVQIFIYSIIPSLFPFIFFTEFILNTDILNTVQNTTGKYISKVFRVSKNASPAILTGFLCGFPMGAKTVSHLYDTNQISKKESIKLLSYINNCNPAFILSTIGIGIMYNIKFGILLAISHYLANLLISFMPFKNSSLDIIHENNINLNTFSKKNNIKPENIFEIIKVCIKNSFSTLTMIFGFMLIFNLLFSIINNILTIFNVSNNITAIISGLFEVTIGINNVFNLPLNINTKLITISFLTGFSGLCIIFQIYSCISIKDFSFKSLILFKILHGIISCFITYILLIYTNFFNGSTISIYNSVDELKKNYYIHNMKIAYLVSTLIIILILYIYYIIHKKVAYKNIDYKKEGG